MFARVLLVGAVLCAATKAEPPRDAFGDPLPEGAKARVGTVRLARPVGSTWHSAALSADGKFLLAQGPDGLERVELRTGTATAFGPKVKEFTGHEQLALSADGERGITRARGELLVWDARTGKVLNRVEARAETGAHRMTAGSLSADGGTFAFVTRGDGDEKPLTAVVWTVGDGRRKLDVPVAGLEHWHVELSANGKVLAVFGPRPKPSAARTWSSEIQFWDATSGKKLGTTELKDTWVHALAFAPDGGSAALIDSAGKVVFFDPQTGREVRKLKGRAEIGGHVTFAPDGKRLAFAWGDGTVWVWDAAKDELVSETKCPVSVGGSGAHLRFVGEKRLVACGTSGARAFAWDVPSGAVLTPTGGRVIAPFSMAFSADGKELLMNGEKWTELTVERWDAATGKFLGARECDLGREPRAGQREVTVLSGARVLALEAWHHHLFDARTGKLLHDLGPTGETDSPFLSDDGELMLVPQGVTRNERPPADKPLKFAVREPGAAKPRCEIELPNPNLKAAKRTPDGKRFLTATELPADPEGHKFTVLALWDAATGKKAGETKVRGTHFTFAPTNDAGVIATNADNAWQPARLLDLTTGKERDTFDTGGMTADAGPVLSADGKLVAFGLNAASKSEVRVFDVGTGKLLHTFRGHTGRISTLAFSPNGRLLASGAYDTTALIWELPAPQHPPSCGPVTP